MHAPAPLQFTVHRFGVWRGLLAVVGASMGAAVAAWFATTAAPAWLGAAGVVMLLAGWSGLAALARCAPVSLRWDTQHWHLGTPGTQGPEPLRCELELALDLGGWMLLKLQPTASAAAPWRVRWLAVQRYGHEGSWHMLRCTVHSSRSHSSGAMAAVLVGAGLP